MTWDKRKSLHLILTISIMLAFMLITLLSLDMIGHSVQALNVEMGSRVAQSSHLLQPINGISVTQQSMPVPGAIVKPGDLITYTLLVTNHGGSAISGLGVTDDLPLSTSFVVSNFSSGTVTTNPNILVWEIGTLPASVSASGQFVVRVETPSRAQALITNSLAGFMNGSSLLPSIVITHQIDYTPTVYMPILLKPDPTLTFLYINSSNTGGIVPFEIRSTADDSLIHTCNIGNNLEEFCGSFVAGTYKALAYTGNCGLLQTTLMFDAGSQSINVKCF